jgi:uncharacterized protein (TIGR00297 family)
MGEEMHGTERDTGGSGGWKKAIPRVRDRMQSRALVWVVVPLLVVAAAWVCLRAGSARALLFPVLFSFGFAALVWGLRSATLTAAGVGLLVCLIMVQRSMAIAALIALFALTFVATRYGRKRKEARGLAEARSGRRASQVVANLGVAALCAAVGWYAGCIAALAEAAADTVSSEIGQTLGGKAWLITTFRRVEAGQDGGVSFAGTLAGVLAAAVVVTAGSVHHALWGVVFVAACAGLLFDSLLGATVEEWGWLGNDLVNFLSTLFAAGVAWVLLRVVAL